MDQRLTNEPFVPYSWSSVVATAHPSTSDAPPRSRPWLVFGGLAVLAFGLRLACTTGLIGSDDLRYVKYARAIMEGHYDETLEEASRSERLHPALRYGLIIPLAGIYRLFGVTEWSTIALPLLASTVSVLLLVQIGRQLFDMRAGIVAGLLYATFPLQLRYATVLVPEPIAECFALAGVLCYVNARRRDNLLWMAAGALIGAAYLAKEPALFIAPALLLHAALERRWRGALLLLIGLAGVIGAELAYYLIGQGDMLFRPHSTQLFTVNDENASGANPDLLYQLFVKYPRMMIVPNVEFGLHSLACLVWAASALALHPRRGYMFIAVWAGIPWLYLNFGSWSLEYYVTLPRAQRYIEFTYPPLMLLSGVALSRAFNAPARIARPAAATLAIVLIVGVASGLWTRGEGYRTGEMTVLREIVRRAQEAPGQTIYTDDDRWREALDVLGPSLVSTSAETATFTLVRNPLGLPSVQRQSPPPDTTSHLD